MLDWEFGDMVAWVSIDSCKPFPVNIYKKNEQWSWQAHKDNLTTEERIEIEAFVKDTLNVLQIEWKPNMKRRLNWDTTRLKKRKK